MGFHNDSLRIAGEKRKQIPTLDHKLASRQLKEGDYIYPSHLKRSNGSCQAMYSDDIDPPLTLPITCDKLLSPFVKMISLTAFSFASSNLGQ